MRRLGKLLIWVLLISSGSFASYIAWLGLDDARPSRCHGDIATGRLDDGRRLPYAGENYRAYSLLGFLSGRTFMHSSVRNAVRASYGELAKQNPELRFVYAESGWPWGGGFAPHKTHHNGTSVDFHVPVRTLDGQVAELPASVFNKLGYSISFDKSGRSGNQQIDFQAMAQHLLALQRASRAQGISIRRVIFDVRLQPKLFATSAGAQLSQALTFNTAQAWVPHDQHYHVDFAVPCR